MPVNVYVLPFQTALSQDTKLSFVDMELLIVKSIVTMLSQPAVVCSVSTYIPVIVYVLPFQIALSQATKLSFVDIELLIVKSIVIMLSQPAVVCSVSM